MPLEAVMLCVDNSDYARNGDYEPSRFDVQAETVNTLCSQKTNDNPETGVGLMTMAGERAEILLNCSNDFGEFITALAKMRIGGKTDVLRAIQCAQLCLKHRQNKNQRQRVVVFVGSPVSSTKKQMETLGKNLKKNNVSLDVLSFGEIEDNKEKLEALVTACNSNDTSHYVELPNDGVRHFQDMVISSPAGLGESAAGGAGGAGGDFEFGVDPSMDPELALALRISMEEERRRQEGPNAGGSGGEAVASADGSAAPAPQIDIEGFDEMDEELRQALLLSVQEQEGGGAPAAAAPEAAPAPAASSSSAAADPAAATAAGEPAGKKQKTGDGGEELFEDPDFVKDLLGSLEGVDMDDPNIQAAIKGDAKKEEKKEDEKKDKKEDEK